ncbi:preprotein translocase subunit SecY [Spiroplasma mirum ATCC 29335]|uniref:Protein translocase subunit SecY n=1 Tax=Spiroplasma mirum ATCC 29335 TaxID=838561 RepID=W0GQ44_9MOLU|nr:MULTISPECIES: preprotein translocase subunit SecY [Spiroplasma]AHF60744.1 preprotein translocase subunit SecY [Spiroplasma mirum ATCC 29335]AHI57705.1 preprotein translocase subunit SecY [Spiroplasma mirum ATCC 29335]AKM52863.1 preprotein translocase subunit SecY [Spiroplasma atrichopogonis]
MKTKAKKRKAKKAAQVDLVKSNNFFVKNKDLIKRIAFTLIVLVVIRLGSYLTVPGVTVSPNIQDLSNTDQFFSLISMLGGGTLGKFSILALGVSPYITASIIVQLLSTDVIQPLSRWAKGGEKGRKKLDRLTKWLTIPFAIMQGVATIFTMANQGIISPKWLTNDFGTGSPIFYYILVPCALIAGTMFMLWIADQITIRGIGNGVSIIIFAGIVAKLPSNLETTFKFWISGQEDINLLFDGILKFLVYVVMFLLVILFVVMLNESERKLPIQQTGSGLSSGGEQNKPFLPLKINSAGVIPVIFASALISAPITVSQIISVSNPNNGFVQFTNNYLSFSTWPGIIIYAILTILFTFLYSQVQMNPEKIAENFQKAGTFIPSVRPGKETEKYIKGTINRLSILGSIFLAAIAILPYVISKLTSLPSALAIGGTGLIIMVSVALETMRQIKGRITQQAFIDKKSQSLNQDSNDNSYLW